MIEQYVFNKISGDSTLSTLLTKDSVLHLYPSVVPRGVDTFDNAVTFTTISVVDVYPASKSVNVQFNIFSKEHIKSAQIAQALSDLFNEDNHQKDGGVDMVFSIRKSESDLGFNFDTNIFQRETTYYFKLR